MERGAEHDSYKELNKMKNITVQHLLNFFLTLPDLEVCIWEK